MTQYLLSAILLLVTFCISLLLFYYKKFGKPYWRGDFITDSDIDEILFIQVPIEELKLQKEQQADLDLLKQNNYRTIASFSIPVISEAKCIFLKNNQNNFWVCCFYFSNQHLVAFSTFLNDTNKVLTITNRKGKHKLTTKKIIRYNKEKVSLEELLSLSQEVKAQKQLLSFKDYLSFFKKIFINDLIAIYNEDIEQSTLMAPSFYSTFERERLFKAYAKRNNIHEETLLEKSAQILIINNDTYIEYLVSRLLVQVSTISHNKARLIKSAEETNDIKTWFKSINNHLPEDKKFIYMGNVKEPIDSDFYFCQRISVSGADL